MKAATGQDVTAEELGGADVHTRKSGVADHRAADDEHALALAREIVAHLGDPQPCPWQLTRSRAARGRSGRPLRADPRGLPPRGRPARADRTDRRRLALPRVQGAVRRDARLRLRADRGLPGRRSWRTAAILFAESSQKGAHFVELACKRRIPLVFLQNITGFMVGKVYEEGGIARDGAKLVMAVACADVPKFTVVTGGSFGAGNYAMCGRAYGPRQLWMWPNARISVMGGDQAATVLTMVGDAEPGRDPGEVRDRGQPVLLHRAALGRRHHRPARHAPRARARSRRRCERACARDDVRCLPDVTATPSSA